MRKKINFKKIVFYIGFIASIVTILSIFTNEKIFNSQTSSGSQSPNIIINKN